MNTLQSIFDTSKSSNALVDPVARIELSYSHLQIQIDQFKSQLVHLTNAGPGDCFSLIATNSLEFVIAFLGTALARCVSAPLNPKFTANELEFYLSDSKSKAVLVQKPLLDSDPKAPIIKIAKKLNITLLILDFGPKGVSLSPLGGLLHQPNSTGSILSRPQPDDIALLLHTSGTTGKPKAVPLTHQNLSRTMGNIVNTYALTPSDTTFIVMPLFHVHGLIGALLSTLLSGGCAVIPPKFSATKFWEEYAKWNCSWYTAVPTIHQVLLNYPAPPSSTTIRFIRSCSSSLAAPTFHSLEEKFKAPILEAYAMTEAAHQMTSNPLPPAARKPGSVGIPQGVEVKILNDSGDEVEEGEVCIRGINVTSGYLNNTKANKESYHQNGFFRTGDQGKLDNKGYLFLTGRIKELINRGGEKISPLELDAVLLRYPGIAEAVSFAVPDSKYGQEVHAVVKLSKDAKVTSDDLRKHCLEHVADFKVPKKFYFAPELPKTATGKIQRRKMVDFFFNKSKL